MKCRSVIGFIGTAGNQLTSNVIINKGNRNAFIGILFWQINKKIPNRETDWGLINMADH